MMAHLVKVGLSFLDIGPALLQVLSVRVRLGGRLSEGNELISKPDVPACTIARFSFEPNPSH